MAYVKTVWETGDIITAEKLNNIEDGVEDASVSDVYEMEGIITVNQQFVPQSFTLTSGDVTEIPLHKLVKMKSTVSVGGQSDAVEMFAVLGTHNLGTVIGSESYHFSTILFLQSKVYYASVFYTVSTSTWGAAMIELAQATS